MQDNHISHKLAQLSHACSEFYRAALDAQQTKPNPYTRVGEISAADFQLIETAIRKMVVDNVCTTLGKIITFEENSACLELLARIMVASQRQEDN